jgi:hypothetical protein
MTISPLARAGSILEETIEEVQKTLGNDLDALPLNGS